VNTGSLYGRFAFDDRVYGADSGHGELFPDGIEYFVSDLTTTSQKFEEGLLINNEGKLGYINQWGRPILEPIYDDIQPYNEDYLLVQKEGFQFYATKHSTEIPQEKNCAVWSINQPLSENFIAVQYQNQAGFIDYLCRLRISVRYEAVQSFSENLAAIKIAGKWGYIDSEERLIIQPRYQTVSAFQNGYAVVQKNNLYGIIDKSGETILPFEYDAINRTENRHWLLRKGSDLGILSKDFQSIIFPKYTSLQDNSSNTVIVEKAGKFGIDNLNGVHIRFQEYDLIKHWQKSIYLFTTPPQTTILN